MKSLWYAQMIALSVAGVFIELDTSINTSKNSVIFQTNHKNDTKYVTIDPVGSRWDIR
jgi:hypothetical protein